MPVPAVRGAWTLGRIRGIPVRLHISLALILPLLALSFAGRRGDVVREATLRALLRPPPVPSRYTYVSHSG